MAADRLFIWRRFSVDSVTESFLPMHAQWVHPLVWCSADHNRNTLVRRLSCNRYLRLDSDGLILPTGFLRLRPARIPYTSIERVWQTSIPWMAVLCIATKEGKFEVLSGMLPDTGSYLAVREFLNWQAKNNLNN